MKGFIYLSTRHKPGEAMQVPSSGEHDARPGRQVLPFYDAQHAWGLAIHQPAFLPGSAIEQTDPATERMDSLPGASKGLKYSGSLGRSSSLGSSVLALDPPTRVSHPTTGDASAAQAVTALTGPFKLRGELMHSFISYRVATEGEASNANNFSGLLAEKIRALSTDSTLQLQIPRHGWGIWPRGAKKPVPFRKEEAKVFLDRECLQVPPSCSLFVADRLYIVYRRVF